MGDLLLDYAKKPAAADAKYKGKRIRVEGEVREAHRDASGAPWIVLGVSPVHGSDDIHQVVGAHYVGESGHVRPPLAELRFDQESAARASTLAPDKRLLLECTVEGFSERVRLTACGFADTRAYDVCVRNPFVSCILPGWRDAERVPFVFHWVRDYGSVDGKKVIDAWVDDGRAPFLAPNVDPQHMLSDNETHYAWRTIGMVVRVDSLEDYDRALSAMDAEADAGVLGSRYIGSRGARTFVLLPPHFEVGDMHETGLRHALEEEFQRSLDQLPPRDGIRRNDGPP